MVYFCITVFGAAPKGEGAGFLPQACSWAILFGFLKALKGNDAQSLHIHIANLTATTEGRLKTKGDVYLLIDCHCHGSPASQTWQHVGCHRPRCVMGQWPACLGLHARNPIATEQSLPKRWVTIKLQARGWSRH